MIVMNQITTPIGPMLTGATDEGLCLLEFVDRGRIETELKDLKRLLNADIIEGKNKHTIQAYKELEEYFTGKRKIFEVALHTPGTPFQNKVWKMLTEIPFGETRSYQEQALKIQQPNAVRAVASANGCNRIAITIPCLKVNGKVSNLVGYGGGLERKRWLLNHERQFSDIRFELFT